MITSSSSRLSYSLWRPGVKPIGTYEIIIRESGKRDVSPTRSIQFFGEHFMSIRPRLKSLSSYQTRSELKDNSRLMSGKKLTVSFKKNTQCGRQMKC